MSAPIGGILLVTPPGRIRTGLLILLKSLYPQVVICAATNAAAAEDQIMSDCHWLILVDADLPAGDLWRLALAPPPHLQGCQVISLTHYPQQSDLSQAAGVPALSLEGLTSEILRQALSGYLQ
jgi:hypothetical protein